jgi:hypothetical protein
MRTALSSSLFALLLVSGCHEGTGLPPAADPEKARASLRTALDAWQQGEQPDSLKNRTPAIYFTDFAWQGGQRLLKYELGEQTKGVGQQVVCSAVLSLAKGNDKPYEKKARYLIDTDPAIVIVPADPE